MPKSIRSITVSFNAGTAGFVRDVDKAKAKVKEFGGSATSGIRAIGTELRLLEGNVNNNVRGVEVFLSSFPKLRSAMIAAFPLAGGLAFGGLVAELGEKVAAFFKKVREAPEAISTAFRTTNAGLRLTNDELEVANARLEQDIAKLEGKHENTLAIALTEARKAADTLADSLDKDLEKVQRLLKEQNVEWTERLLGQAGTQDLQDLITNLRKDVAADTLAGAEKVRAAKTPAAATAAQDAMDATVKARYAWYLSRLDQMLKDAEALQAKHDNPRLIDYGPVAGRALDAAPDQAQRIGQLKGLIGAVGLESLFVSDQSTNIKLTARKEGDQALHDNAEAEKPFESKRAALQAEIDGLMAKLDAAGQGEAGKVLAEAFAAAAKDIEEVNKALAKHNTALTAEQKAEIEALEMSKAKTAADEEWRTKFVADTRSISERVEATNLLTAAIGKSYDATRAANVESQLMQKFGADYNNPARAADLAAARSYYGDQFDAEHAKVVGESLQKLQEEITLERSLAAAQRDGALAVAQATLAAKLRTIARENDAESAKKLMAAEIELFQAQQVNKTAEAVAKLDEEIAATERLTAATLKGAAAVRAATLANELAKIAREGDTPIPGLVGMGSRGLAAVRQAGAAYGDELAKAWAAENPIQGIDDQITKLKEARDLYGDTLGIEIKLRDLENERLRTLAQQTLEQRKAQDGVKAFFIEMQTDAESAAQIIYTALNSAVNGTADNLAKMAMGERPKGGWGQMWGKEFRGIGEKTASSAIGSMEHAGLGALGKLLGVKGPASKPSGRPGDPVHVYVDNAQLASGGGAGLDDLSNLPVMPPGSLPAALLTAGGSLPSFLASKLGSLLGKVFGGGGGGTATSSISFGGFMAGGGAVSPDKAYIVGDDGPEVLAGASGRIVSNSELQRTFGGPSGDGGTTYIDARGADLGVLNRLARAQEMQGRRAVAAAMHAMRERELRTPRGREAEVGMESAKAAYVADSDPEFLQLRADIRSVIVEAEASFRVSMAELLADFPPDLALAFQPWVTDLPARFIRGLLPLFVLADDMRARDEVTRLLTQRGSSAIN